MENVSEVELVFVDELFAEALDAYAASPPAA